MASVISTKLSFIEAHLGLSGKIWVLSSGAKQVTYSVNAFFVSRKNYGGKMKIQLNIQLSKNLREKVNEINNFSFNKTAYFQFPSDKKGSTQEGNAFNCICAALDRIDDLVKHINSLDLTQTTEGTFALCDFLNYGQTLIDCITIIGKVYGVKYESKDDCSCFHQRGNYANGNDEKYFKYLRSLCAVHPLATYAHSEYQGNQPEWCPYINIASSSASRLLVIGAKELKGADYIARVYRNDMEFSKYVPIKVKQLFKYLQNRYNFINNIIQAIEYYNQNQIKRLCNNHILLPDECESYDNYLENLEDEIHIRCGDLKYIVRTWRAIFMTHFEDSVNETLLDEYKAELKVGIERIRAGLQDMSCLNDDFSFEAIAEENIPEIEGYHYEQEKLSYLFPSYAIESENVDFSFISKKSDLDIKRIDLMLNMIDIAQQRGVTHEDLKEVGRYIDSKLHTTNSEWARIQIKIMEPILGKYIKFDYLLNDWLLYLQTKIAKWLLSRSHVNEDNNGQ